MSQPVGNEVGGGPPGSARRAEPPRLLTMGMVACSAGLSMWLSGQWLWSRALGAESGAAGFWSAATAALFLPGVLWASCALAFSSHAVLGWAAMGTPTSGRARALAWACCAALGAQMAAACALELSAASGSAALWAGMAVGSMSTVFGFLRARRELRFSAVGRRASGCLALSVALAGAGICVAVLGALPPRTVAADSAEAFGEAVAASIEGAELARSRDAGELVLRLARWEAEQKLGGQDAGDADKSSSPKPADKVE